MAQVMKSILNHKEFFQLYRFSLSRNRYFRIIQSMGTTFTKHAAQGDSLPFLKQTVHKNVIFKENLLFFLQNDTYFCIMNKYTKHKKKRHNEPAPLFRRMKNKNYEPT